MSIKIEGEQMPDMEDEFDKPSGFSANKKGKQFKLRIR